MRLIIKGDLLKRNNPNSDGLVNWLPQPRLSSNEPPESKRLNLYTFIKSSGTLTALSPGTESVGLRADAHGVMVFANPSRLFHRAPGLTILTRTWYHLDYFIVHPDSSVICQDLQKPRHRDTDAN